MHITYECSVICLWSSIATRSTMLSANVDGSRILHDATDENIFCEILSTKLEAISWQTPRFSITFLWRIVSLVAFGRADLGFDALHLPVRLSRRSLGSMRSFIISMPCYCSVPSSFTWYEWLMTRKLVKHKLIIDIIRNITVNQLNVMVSKIVHIYDSD